MAQDRAKVFRHIFDDALNMLFASQEKDLFAHTQQV